MMTDIRSGAVETDYGSQVPAVLQSCEIKDQGITVVISRSISFLIHAADVLRRLGIPTGVLAPSRESGTLKEPSKKILAQIRRGQIRILYLFCPFCTGSDVIHAVKSTPGGLHRLVVTDAEYSSPQVGNTVYLPTMRSMSHTFMAAQTPRRRKR